MSGRVFAAIVVAGGMLSVACSQQSGGGIDFLESSPVPDTVVGPLAGSAGTTARQDANPFAGNLMALADGRRYFVQYNCAGCHGDHGGGGMGPSLRDTTWLYGDSDAHIANSIAEGRAYGMPAWGVMLTEAQIWQITAYIKSLRTADEPDPPA